MFVSLGEWLILWEEGLMELEGSVEHFVNARRLRGTGPAFFVGHNREANILPSQNWEVNILCGSESEI